jgi:hypothetical protein
MEPEHGRAISGYLMVIVGYESPVKKTSGPLGVPPMAQLGPSALATLKSSQQQLVQGSYSELFHKTLRCISGHQFQISL